MSDVDGVAPPGWENSVKRMKKHKDISNPFALAWFLKNRGAHPHTASAEEANAAFDAAVVAAHAWIAAEGWPELYVAAARGEAWAHTQLLDVTRQPVTQERRW
jgi:hypothetical protein